MQNLEVIQLPGPTGACRLAKGIVRPGPDASNDGGSSARQGPLSGSQGSPAKGVLIAVVGPCASGKTSLVRALRRRGYRAREVAQEHSVVPDLWRRVSEPDLLIYLDVSPSSACQRRDLASPASWWPKAACRLELARQSADLHILTDEISPQQVLVRCLTFLEAVGSDRSDSDG